MDPLATILEAEAYALREAVQQIKRLGYRCVTFCGDSKLTFQTLKKCCSREIGGHQAISMYCNDIWQMAPQSVGYRFWAIPRQTNSQANLLAKNARINNGNDVISWLTS